MMQLRRYYTNGKSKSYIIPDLIDDNVTIKGLGFKEIKKLPYDKALDLDNISELSSIMRERPRKGFNDYAWLSAIEHTIEEVWDSSKLNLVMHSSGYDSRVISHFLAKIYRKKPGPILFVCIEPESVQFEKIMRHQGWDESQWEIYDKFADPFNLMFNFDIAWEGMDGATEFPMNTSAACIKYLQMIGKLPDDLSNVVLWTAIFMNELFRYEYPLFKVLRFIYSHRMGPIWGISCPNIVAPIISTRSLKAIFSKSRAKPHLWRDHLVRVLDPKLAKIDNITPLTGQPIPPLVADRMVSDFKSSYYYKHHQVPIPKITHSHEPEENREFWRTWTFASLVEHLVKRGVEVSWE